MDTIQLFNQMFGIPQTTPFKMEELQTEIIKQRHSIQYWYFGSWENTDGTVVPEYYTCGTDFEWEMNSTRTEEEKYKSPREALAGLFIEHSEELYNIVATIYGLPERKDDGLEDI